MQLTTLGNGLRVASRPMRSVETLAVGLYAATGSRNESARLNGIAHLFEHMVFKGAGGRSAREISETIEDVGGAGLYLLSDLGAGTTGEVLHVDSGYHVVGMKAVDAPDISTV